MKLTKIRIPILSEDEVSMRCTHEELWPPPLARVAASAPVPERWDVDLMWRTGEISQHDYQQIETWKRACGVMEMGQGCLNCHLAKLEEVVKYSNEVRHFPLKKLLEQLRQEAGLPLGFPLGQVRDSALEGNPVLEPAPKPQKVAKVTKKTTKKSTKKTTKKPTKKATADSVDAALVDYNRRKAEKLEKVEKEVKVEPSEDFQIAEPDYPLQDTVGSGSPVSFDSQDDNEDDDLLDALLEE